MSASGESGQWHDATDEPPRGTVLWVYLGADREFRRVEMGTWGETGWRSALNPSVTYDTDAVSAWAVIEYPPFPVRCWADAPSGGDAR